MIKRNENGNFEINLNSPKLYMFFLILLVFINILNLLNIFNSHIGYLIKNFLLSTCYYISGGSLMIILIILVCLIGDFLKSLINRSFYPDIKGIIFWSKSILILFLAALPVIIMIFGYRTTQIGDFYEDSSYTQNYIVMVSENPNTVKNRQVDYITAEIEKNDGYYIKNLYFDSVIYYDFEDVYPDNEVFVYREIPIKTDDGLLYITLTDNKAIPY